MDLLEDLPGSPFCIILGFSDKIPYIGSSYNSALTRTLVWFHTASEAELLAGSARGGRTYMKELHTDIEIAAPVERVWALLVDLQSYKDWNPFIREGHGELREGARIRVRIQLPGRLGMSFHPRVLIVRPGHEIRWVGHFMTPGIINGEHIFLLEPLGVGRVRLVQKEIFRGLLVPLLWSILNRNTRRGFEQMNRALKARAEADV